MSCLSLEGLVSMLQWSACGRFFVAVSIDLLAIFFDGDRDEMMDRLILVDVLPVRAWILGLSNDPIAARLSLRTDHRPDHACADSPLRTECSVRSRTEVYFLWCECRVPPCQVQYLYGARTADILSWLRTDQPAAHAMLVEYHEECAACIAEKLRTLGTDPSVTPLVSLGSAPNLELRSGCMQSFQEQFGGGIRNQPHPCSMMDPTKTCGKDRHMEVRKISLFWDLGISSFIAACVCCTNRLFDFLLSMAPNLELGARAGVLF